MHGDTIQSQYLYAIFNPVLLKPSSIGMHTALACIFRYVQLFPNAFVYFYTVAFIIFLIAAEYLIMLKWLSFLQLQKVHTLRAWLTLNSLSSGHFARNELSQERQPLGKKGCLKSVAIRDNKGATLLGQAWATVLCVETVELWEGTCHPWGSWCLTMHWTGSHILTLQTLSSPLFIYPFIHSSHNTFLWSMWQEGKTNATCKFWIHPVRIWKLLYNSHKLSNLLEPGFPHNVF